MKIYKYTEYINEFWNPFKKYEEKFCDIFKEFYDLIDKLEKSGVFDVESLIEGPTINIKGGSNDIRRNMDFRTTFSSFDKKATFIININTNQSSYQLNINYYMNIEFDVFQKEPNVNNTSIFKDDSRVGWSISSKKKLQIINREYELFHF